MTTPSFPEGSFDLILADPCWQFSYSLPSVGQNIEGRHYDTLPLEDICNLPINKISAEDSVLFLWVPSPKLEEGLEVMRRWGYAYKQNLIWHKLTPTGKQNSGMGHWVRGDHEILLLGTKGHPKTPQDRKTRPHSVFQAPRGRHSAKPQIVYEFIEQMFPHLPRKIELFARNTRENWTSWGLEVP